MIQNVPLLVESGSKATPPPQEKLTHHQHLALLDVVRNVCENAAPYLDFQPDDRDQSCDVAAHPTAPNRSYVIRRQKNGLRQSLLRELGEIAREKEIYRGQTQAAAVGWCRVHALLSDMTTPSFSLDPEKNHQMSCGNYVVTRDPTREGSWHLSGTSGRPIGTWQNPLQAELIARMDHRFGALTQ